jgi:hypothetical protein
VSTTLRRAGVTAVAYICVVAVQRASGMDPRPLPIAGLFAVGLLLYSLVIDARPATPDVAWPIPRSALPHVSDDPRIGNLQRRITLAADADAPTSGLRELLVAVVDDRVRIAHGVDRDVDPERFADIVGSDLLAWLEAPDDTAGRVTRRHLATLLTRIEAL